MDIVNVLQEHWLLSGVAFLITWPALLVFSPCYLPPLLIWIFYSRYTSCKVDQDIHATAERKHRAVETLESDVQSVTGKQVSNAATKTQTHDAPLEVPSLTPEVHAEKKKAAGRLDRELPNKKPRLTDSHTDQLESSDGKSEGFLQNHSEASKEDRSGYHEQDSKPNHTPEEKVEEATAATQSAEAVGNKHVEKTSGQSVKRPEANSKLAHKLTEAPASPRKTEAFAKTSGEDVARKKVQAPKTLKKLSPGAPKIEEDQANHPHSPPLSPKKDQSGTKESLADNHHTRTPAVGAKKSADSKTYLNEDAGTDPATHPTMPVASLPASGKGHTDGKAASF
jgi:hypothetical protein